VVEEEKEEEGWRHPTDPRAPRCTIHSGEENREERETLGTTRVNEPGGSRCELQQHRGRERGGESGRERRREGEREEDE